VTPPSCIESLKLYIIASFDRSFRQDNMYDQRYDYRASCSLLHLHPKVCSILSLFINFIRQDNMYDQRYMLIYFIIQVVLEVQKENTIILHNYTHKITNRKIYYLAKT